MNAGKVVWYSLVGLIVAGGSYWAYKRFAKPSGGKGKKDPAETSGAGDIQSPAATVDPSTLESVIQNFRAATPINTAVEVYTDKVIARMKVDGKWYAGQYKKQNKGFSIYGPSGSLVSSGLWSNGGKTITLSNQRVIAEQYVWTALTRSIEATK